MVGQDLRKYAIGLTDLEQVESFSARLDNKFNE